MDTLHDQILVYSLYKLEELYTQNAVYFVFILHIVFGFTNAILFFPGSQYAYFVSHSLYGAYNIYSVAFLMSNIIGHIILFALFYKLENKKFFIRLLKKVKEYKIGCRICDKGSMLVLLRCAPFFHSGASILAAICKIDKSKLIITTILGNFIYYNILQIVFKFWQNLVTSYSIMLGIIMLFMVSLFISHHLKK